MLLGEYLKGVKESSVSAPFRVDRGAQVTSGTCSLTSPAQFRTAVGEKAVLSLPDAGSTVYGTAEAHGRSKTQERRRRQPGFAVSRVYENSIPKANGNLPRNLPVGDLVRITLHVDKGPTPLSYVVMEDYLPSALEAVNPALLSQIPGGRENEAASQGDPLVLLEFLGIAPGVPERQGALLCRYLEPRTFYGPLPGAGNQVRHRHCPIRQGGADVQAGGVRLEHSPETDCAAW